MTDELLLEARALSKRFVTGGQTLDVLTGVDLSITRGETLAIVGASGAGKSTLLHLLGLLDRPTSGEVLFRGASAGNVRASERARIRRVHIGFVFQFYHLIPELSALENVLLASMMDRSIGEWLGQRAAHKRNATELLTGLGLGQRLHHRPALLSGGERQRVAIARALANDPEIVLCDEPTGNLDEKTAAEIVELLFELSARTKKSFVFVTHDVDLAKRANRAFVLHLGKLEPM